MPAIKQIVINKSFVTDSGEFLFLGSLPYGKYYLLYYENESQCYFIFIMRFGIAGSIKKGGFHIELSAN
jgi:hypothetical protein